MSARHIDAIVTALEDCDRTEIGTMLWRENLNSIHYRYPDTKENDADYPGPIGFGAAWVDAYTWRSEPRSDGELAAAIACYEYQSCEHPGWEDSKAYKVTEGLMQAILERNRVTKWTEVPGADDAPWGID